MFNSLQRPQHPLFAAGNLWNPNKLTTPPVFLWDTKVASTITQSSNNVSKLTDARGSTYTDFLTSTGTAQPVFTPATTFAGRPALVFSNANASKMASSDTGALPANDPWYIFALVQFLTTPDYGMIATIGGTQTSAPANGFIASLYNRLWPVYINLSGQVGYSYSPGLGIIDTSAVHAYLVVFDGISIRTWIDGIQQTQLDNISLTIASKQLTLGGEFYPYYGQCPNYNGFYGFFGYGGAPSETEVNKIYSFANKNFGIGTGTRLTVNHGCSIEAGYGLSGPASGWPQLAANQATIVPTVKSYAVVGLGIGWITGQNTIADSSVNTNGTWLLGNPTGTVAAPTYSTVGPYSSVWNVSPPNSPNKWTIYWGSTLSTNDLFFGATGSQAYFSQQIQAAYVNSLGGTFVPCTVFPRNGYETPVGFEAQRQAYNALVAAGWNQPLKSARIIGATNTSPVVIKTPIPHSFVTGDQVNIELVTGNTICNNAQGSPWTVTVVDSTHFSLNGSTGNGAWAGGGIAFSGTGLGAKYWMDPGNLPEFSVTTNTTYFQSDQTHPTAVGQNVIATVAGPGTGAMSPVQIINALG